MSRPRISVILPVHNGEKYLAECLDSLLTQTVTDFEIIVIDDGSTDGTAELLDRYRGRDTRVVPISEGKRGFVGALSRGLEFARGHYIARMDADDVCLPDRFGVQLRHLDAHPDVVGCGTATEVFGDTPNTCQLFPTSPHQIRVNLLFWSCFSHPTMMMRRGVFEIGDLGYRADYGGAADYDLWCQFDRRGLKLHNIPQVLLRYRRHPAQITTADSDRQFAVANRIRREHLAHYGLAPTESELRVHSLLGGWHFPALADSITQVEAWLSKLRATLGADGRFEPTELSALLRGYWYSTCSASLTPGWRTVGRFLGSRLGRWRFGSAFRLAAKIVTTRMRGDSHTPA